VPAAAVIPAPIAYIKVVAVKKLVVGSRGVSSSSKNDIQEGPVRCGAVCPPLIGQPVGGEPGRPRSLACTGPPALSFRLPVLPIELAEDVGMGSIQASVGSGVGSGAGLGLPPSSSFRQASGLVRDPDQLL